MINEGNVQTIGPALQTYMIGNQQWEQVLAFSPCLLCGVGWKGKSFSTRFLKVVRLVTVPR
jgi:hypothetical protein